MGLPGVDNLPSKINLKSGVNEHGKTEFYFMGLDIYEDFDVVVDYLIGLNGKLLDNLNGIYSRIATLNIGDMIFKVIYHEDLGVYAYALGEISETDDIKLRYILEKIVALINGI